MCRRRLTHRTVCDRNCVSTVNLQVHPDLMKIATHARNVEYNPKVWRWHCGCICLRVAAAVTSSHAECRVILAAVLGRHLPAS